MLPCIRDSGTDLHFEASVERKLSKEFSLGVQAFHRRERHRAGPQDFAPSTASEIVVTSVQC
jgi:hypothetical protein